MEDGVVLVDFDSTLNMFDEHARLSIYKQFQIEYECANINDWGFYNNLLTPEQQDWFWGEENFGSESWTLALPAQRDAVAALNYLIENGFKPHVVSDRKLHMQAWISTWLTNLGFPEVPVTVSDKINAPKYAHVWKHQMVAAIEDAPHNVVAIARKCQIPVFLIDKPWNRDVRNNPWIYRVDSLGDASKQLVEWFKE